MSIETVPATSVAPEDQNGISDIRAVFDELCNRLDRLADWTRHFSGIDAWVSDLLIDPNRLTELQLAIAPDVHDRLRESFSKLFRIADEVSVAYRNREIDGRLGEVERETRETVKRRLQTMPPIPIPAQSPILAEEPACDSFDVLTRHLVSDPTSDNPTRNPLLPMGLKAIA